MKCSRSLNVLFYFLFGSSSYLRSSQFNIFGMLCLVLFLRTASYESKSKTCTNVYAVGRRPLMWNGFLGFLFFIGGNVSHNGGNVIRRCSM